MFQGDISGLGFWIFVAALIVGGMWKESRQQAEKHETLRRIVEKTGTIDEAKLKELFRPAEEQSYPGLSYRALRVAGTIIMFAGAGLAAFFLIPKLFLSPIEWWYGGFSIAVGVAILGLGVFFSSRFAEPPANSRSDPPSR